MTRKRIICIKISYSINELILVNYQKILMIHINKNIKYSKRIISVKISHRINDSLASKYLVDEKNQKLEFY